MILTTLLATAVVLAPPAPMVCPIMGSPVSATSKSFDDYAGVRFTYCCAGCDAKFAADPAKSIAKMTEKKWVGGKSLFDPVNGSRVYEAKAKGFSDYKGVRFFFENAANKTKFDAKPVQYGELPKQESLVCPVSEEKIGGYANASNFKDFQGVRYYLCCGGCIDPFNKDTAKFAAIVKKSVKAPAIANATKNEGGHPEKVHGTP